jgi:hypothetical protein
MKTIRGMARLALLAGAAVAAALLGGCKTDGEVADGAIGRLVGGEFTNIEPVEVQVGGETYRVFDKPPSSKMLITKSIGWLLINGPTGFAPKPPFEAAAAQHLANTGRISCRVTEVSANTGASYGVKYDCTPPAAAKLKR